METELVAALAGFVGLCVGVTVTAAVRLSERQPPARSEPELPPGIASVLEALPSSAIVVDGTQRVLRASPAARAYHLVSGDRLVVEELAAGAARVRVDGEIREFELSAPGPGREPPTFAVRIAPLSVGGLVLVLAVDQTDRQRVEAVRRDFVANISHELKTPVGALSLLAETVEEAADDPDAVRRFAGRMRHEANRLVNVVSDVITLSQVQDGEPLNDPVAVPVDGLVAEAVDRGSLAAEEKRITLRSSVPVEGGRRGLAVYGDEQMLGTAVRNLVDNAIAYSGEDGQVVIDARADGGDRVTIAVSDQGIGIPEADLDRIFERFYRVDSARSRATGGTGLGLAIVKHIMAVHDGEVTVRSAEGKGSTFTLRLPAPPRPGEAGS